MERIHKNAFKAAEAASCAGDYGKFWEMHGLLFANQQKLDVASLKSYAEQLGLQPVEFSLCLDGGKHAKAIRADMAVAARLGISGTPNFWIGFRDAKDSNKAKVVRNLRGAQAYSQFKSVFDSLLEEAGK